jgi:hypothetical protein
MNRTSAAAAAEREREGERGRGREGRGGRRDQGRGETGTPPSSSLPPVEKCTARKRKRKNSTKETEQEPELREGGRTWPAAKKRGGRKRKKKEKKKLRSQSHEEETLHQPSRLPKQRLPSMSSLNPAAPAFIPSSSPPATEFDWEVRETTKRQRRSNEAMRKKKESATQGRAPCPCSSRSCRWPLVRLQFCSQLSEKRLQM